MAPKSPDPDPGARVREQVRRIITDEDLACLGLKVRPPIPVSEEERVALARLRHLDWDTGGRRPAADGAWREPKPPGSSGSSE